MPIDRFSSVTKRSPEEDEWTNEHGQPIRLKVTSTERGHILFRFRCPPDLSIIREYRLDVDATRELLLVLPQVVDDAAAVEHRLQSLSLHDG